MTRSSSTRRPSRLLAVALGLAAGVALSEWGVRAYVAWRAQRGLVQGYVLSDVSGIGYLPGIESRSNGVPFGNNLGLIDDLPTELVKPAGRIRLLVVGDSVAQVVLDGDPSNLQQDLFAARLERILRERSGKDVEVLNLSAVGLSLAQEILLLQARGLRLDPDIVVFAYCYNDPIETEVGRSLPWVDAPSFPAMLWLYRKLRIDQEALHREHSWYAPNGPIYGRLRSTFADLGSLARQRHVAVVGLPLLWNDPARQIHLPAVKALAAGNNIPYIDLWSRLSATNLEAFSSRELPHDHIHYTPQAHEAVAGAIAEALLPALQENRWPPSG